MIPLSSRTDRRMPLSASMRVLPRVHEAPPGRETSPGRSDPRTGRSDVLPVRPRDAGAAGGVIDLEKKMLISFLGIRPMPVHVSAARQIHLGGSK